MQDRLEGQLSERQGICSRLPSASVSTSLPRETHTMTGHTMTLPASSACR